MYKIKVYNDVSKFYETFCTWKNTLFYLLSFYKHVEINWALASIGFKVGKDVSKIHHFQEFC